MRRLKSLKEHKCDRCGTVIPVGSHYYRMTRSRDHLAYQGLTICCLSCQLEIETKILVQSELGKLQRGVQAFLFNQRESLEGMLDASLNKIRAFDLKSFFEDTPAMLELLHGYWNVLWDARKTLKKVIRTKWQKNRVPIAFLSKLVHLNEEMSHACQQYQKFRDQMLEVILQKKASQQISFNSRDRDHEEQEAFLMAHVNQKNPLDAVMQSLKAKYQKFLENSLSFVLQARINDLIDNEKSDVMARARQHLQIAKYLNELSTHWSTIEKLTDFTENEKHVVEKQLNHLVPSLESLISELMKALKEQADRFDQDTANLILGIAKILTKEHVYQQELRTFQIMQVSEIIENATTYQELETLEQRFPILLEPSCPKNLKIALEQKRQEYRTQKIKSMALEHLKSLATAVKDEEWWPINTEKELLACVSELPPEDQLEIAQQMMSLFQEFSERIRSTADEFMEAYPEVFQEPNLVPVKLSDDTGWGSLLGFDLENNKWIPAWDESWLWSFPHVNYTTRYSVKNSQRKKRRGQWELKGELPVGTLLMISYPPQASGVLKLSPKSNQPDNNFDDHVSSNHGTGSSNFISAEKVAEVRPRKIRRYFIVSHQAQEDGSHVREIHPRPREIMKLISFMKGELTSEALRSKALLYTKKVAPTDFSKYVEIFENNENIVNGIHMIEEASLDSSAENLTTMPSLGMMLHAVLSGTSRQAFQQQYLIISRLIRENDMKTLEKISKIVKSPHIKLLLQSYRQIQSLSVEELNKRAAKKKVVFVEDEKLTTKCTVCFETFSDRSEIAMCVECNIPTCRECADLLREEASPCPGYLLTGRLHLFSVM